jgi:hypothetical protein
MNDKLLSESFLQKCAFALIAKMANLTPDVEHINLENFLAPHALATSN